MGLRKKEVLQRGPEVKLPVYQGISPGHFLPEKYANNVVEIEAGRIKQYFSSRSWIDETIR